MTFIPGESENSSQNVLNGKDAAIPDWVDNWFHGDQVSKMPDSIPADLTDPDNRSELPTKDLDEFDEKLPKYRVLNHVQVGLEETADGVEPNVGFFNDLAPVTLEGTPLGDSDEEHDRLPGNEEVAIEDNALRDDGCVADWFEEEYGTENWGKQEPTTKDQVDERSIEIESSDGETVEGVQVTSIVGGSDVYLETMADVARERTADWVPAIQWLQKELVDCGANIVTAAAMASLAANVPNFYTYLDVIVMADGSYLIRLQDASPYPRHALYQDGQKIGTNDFDKGEEWKPNQSLTTKPPTTLLDEYSELPEIYWITAIDTGNRPFQSMGIEANIHGLTPFGPYHPTSYRYKHRTSPASDHPLVDSGEGNKLDVSDLESQPLYLPD